MQRLLVVSTGNARRGRRTGGVWRERDRDALGEPLGDLMLGHRRPILDRVAVHEMDGVPVAAKGAGAGRHVIGEDPVRSEEHTSELQSQSNLVCRLLLETKKLLRRRKTTISTVAAAGDMCSLFHPAPWGDTSALPAPGRSVRRFRDVVSSTQSHKSAHVA